MSSQADERDRDPRTEAESVLAARRAGLVYVHEDAPGLRRKLAEDGFVYLNARGRAVRDRITLARIRALAIPPAWTNVWICADPAGHIQATGRDAKGRKQYRYHAQWRALRDQTKFAHVGDFCRALPRIRAKVDADLARPGLTHDKVVATVVRLLELTLIRVGNDEYARANKSFGLTTLRNRHVKADGTRLTFEFVGKSGVRHSTGVRDRRLARIIRQLQDLPGQRLFQYIDDAGVRRQIGSADVNAYLRDVTGAHFTAKDFRTWAGTVAAAKALARQMSDPDAKASRAAVNLCVKEAAALLGNTPAVCRSAYIHPAVLDAFSQGGWPDTLAIDDEGFESALLAFLDANAMALAA